MKTGMRFRREHGGTTKWPETPIADLKGMENRAKPIPWVGHSHRSRESTMPLKKREKKKRKRKRKKKKKLCAKLQTVRNSKQASGHPDW